MMGNLSLSIAACREAEESSDCKVKMSPHSGYFLECHFIRHLIENENKNVACGSGMCKTGVNTGIDV